jgi:hypothetical protein
MKGAINYVGGVTVSYLVLMKISKDLHRDEQAYRYTTNVVNCPFDIFIKTRKLTVTPST